MFKPLPFILSLLILWPLPLHAADLGLGRVSLIQGGARIKLGAGSEWKAAALNAPLASGHRLWCPDGARLEVQLADKSVLRLDQNTGVDILQLQPEVAQFHVSRGRVYVKTGSSGEREVQIDLPNTSVMSDSPAEFQLEFSPQGGAEEISVFNGSVWVAGLGNKTSVRTGEWLALADQNADRLRLKPADAWLRWNLRRDREQSAAAAAAQLPPALAPYARDFNANGEWIEMPGYGRVWRPKVGADWAPFRFGRWVWMNDDYVWLPGESWGWAPCHYGRWIFNGGWCWVPPAPGVVCWSPGAVSWINTPDYIGWVPLAPEELYYGYGCLGPYCVDLLRVPVSRSEFRPAFRNFHYGLTVIPHDDFTAGGTAYITPRVALRRELENPAHFSLGRPEPRTSAGTKRMGPPVPPEKHPGIGAHFFSKMHERYPLLRGIIDRSLTLSRRRRSRPGFSGFPGEQLGRPVHRLWRVIPRNASSETADGFDDEPGGSGR